jgi:ubiquinone/menaquinone biosynthesis C-methylase UbiE
MIRVLEDVDLCHIHDISYVRNTSSTSESDKKELLCWSTDPLESPEGDLFDNILNKAGEMKIFTRLMPCLDLSGRETVLELGGGHCWASALVKRSYPHCYVVASDLSPDAMQFVKNYETILQVSVDEKWAFNCREIPFDSEQFDRIFTFSAFHHFGENNDFSAAIREMVRVLQPEGKIILLHEPSSPQWAYRWFLERANRKRTLYSQQEVDEDALVLPYIKRVCKRLKCRFDAQYFTAFEEREGIVATLYYYTLTQLRPLRRLLPCTVNVVIEKL